MPSVRSTLFQFLDDFSHLIFPYNCAGCGRALVPNEAHVCLFCLSELPLTFEWENRNNAFEQLFWGKEHVQYAASFLYFKKGGLTQRLIHELKYKGTTQIGVILGQFFGHELRKTVFREVDVIIPVPLHRTRQRKRGYNQSDFIAEGIGNELKVPINTHSIVRIRANESQTKKGVYERWINVKELFAIVNTSDLEGKHVLLVDDVVTTGSTLEACTGALLQIKGVKVSVATLASGSPI